MKPRRMTRKKGSGSSSTPVRGVLDPKSVLQHRVLDGLGAVKDGHRSYIDGSVRTDFADSLDLDEAVRTGHETENRWDYLLGHAPSKQVVAVEPHSAKDDEVSTVIAKRVAAKEHLMSHLREGAMIERWLWVASGKIYFANTEKTRRRLDQHGIQFVGKQVMRKHLPGGDAKEDK